MEVERQIILLAQYHVECVIVGGVAGIGHGVSLVTHDLDVCYARTPANLERLAQALKSVNARLRGAPEGLPFVLDAETLKRGLNFTFQTDIGPLDLLGEVAGVGSFIEASEEAVLQDFFGYQFPILSLNKLIAAKSAAGRPKDLLVLAELEAIREAKRARN